jgi:RNA binding exosome subunit
MMASLLWDARLKDFMREEFEKLAAAGKIEGRHVEPLTHLAEAGCCIHRSWGFGRIKTVDTVFARFTIDFVGKPGHTMDLAFAAETLKPIAKDHILARKSADLEEVRRLAAHHLDLIKLVMNSFEGRATADQVQQALVPDVIRDDWKKWWETAKREMKKDGHFVVPSKKTEVIVYQSQETSLQDRILADFRAAKGLRARILIVSEILKVVPDLKDKVALAREVVAALNPDIVTHQRTQPSVALEAIFVRNELYEATGLEVAADDVSEAQIWTQDGVKFALLLETIPASKHHKALESFKKSSPETWHEVMRNSLNQISAVEGGTWKGDQSAYGQQRIAAVVRPGTERRLCGHSRTGSVSRDADGHGAGSVQRAAVQSFARFYFGGSTVAGGTDGFRGHRGDQGFDAGIAVIAGV